MLRHRERRQAGDWAPLDVYDGMSAVSLDLSDNYIGRRSSAVDRNAPGGSAVEGLSMQDVAKRMLLLAEKALDEEDEDVGTGRDEKDSGGNDVSDDGEAVTDGTVKEATERNSEEGILRAKRRKERPLLGCLFLHNNTISLAGLAALNEALFVYCIPLHSLFLHLFLSF